MFEFEKVPDISFIDDARVDEVMSQMVADYKSKYEEITGKAADIGQADPIRLIIYAAAMQIYQAMQYVDFAGKMSFLKYARDEYLDNLAAIRGVKRIEATASTTVLEFRIENPIEAAVAIPAGCKVTNGSEVYFATDEYAEISSGELSVQVSATCTEAGLVGNGFGEGEFTTVVNVLPYVVSARNVVPTSGGDDRETDEDLKNRIFNMPYSYSTAGSVGAYEYYTRLADPTISDVYVTSNNPGDVDIYIVADGGMLPSQTLMDKVAAALDDKTIRPLTDHVQVHSPGVKSFNVNFTYYIPESAEANVTQVQTDVELAVEQYVNWQSAKIGRDIIPSKLIQLVMAAGAKRVEVVSPVYTEVGETELAVVSGVSAVYGGAEDD